MAQQDVQNTQYGTNPQTPSSVASLPSLAKSVAKSVKPTISSTPAQKQPLAPSIPPPTPSPDPGAQEMTIPSTPKPIQPQAPIPSTPTPTSTTPPPPMVQGKTSYNLFDGPLGSNTTTFTRYPTGTYNVRGINVKDSDINQAAKILYGEVSNRTPDKQSLETKNIINVAINRVLSNPKKYGGSLTAVLEQPNQFQSYAPKGIKTKKGVVQSQYQKLQSGMIDLNTDKKFQTIKNTLEEMKSGNFPDTTGKQQFYVHASDGSLHLGTTSKEAKKNALDYEKKLKLNRSQFGTSNGLPAPFQVAENS